MEQLYHVVKQSAGIEDNDRILFHNGKDHYQALLFRRDHLIVIDSMEPHLKKLVKFDALSYILRCLHTPLSAVVKIQKMMTNNSRILIVDDNSPCGLLDERFLPISDIWFQNIARDDQDALVDNKFAELTVHDVISLKPGNHISDNIIYTLGKALMVHNKHVLFVDPLLVEKIVSNGLQQPASHWHENLQKKNFEVILFPVYDRERKRWSILFADLEKSLIGQNNSLRNEASEFIVNKFSSWLQYQGFDTGFFRMQSKEDFDALPVQHEDRVENGVMCICAMICLVERRPMDFSVLDAKDVRKNLIKWMACGYPVQGARHTLWKGMCFCKKFAILTTSSSAR